MALLNVGEFVTCEAGHVIGEIVKPLNPGDRGWGECVGRWRIEQPPLIGQPIPRCPCGAEWCRWYAFHIEGRGWVPERPSR